MLASHAQILRANILILSVKPLILYLRISTSISTDMSSLKSRTTNLWNLFIRILVHAHLPDYKDGVCTYKSTHFRSSISLNQQSVTISPDYLSRHPFPEYNSLNKSTKPNLADQHVHFVAQNAVPVALSIEQLCKATKQDSTLQALIELLQNNTCNLLATFTLPR